MDKSFSARLVGRLSVTIVLASLPAAVGAQSVVAPASYGLSSYSKTEAILGGAPSRLAAIMAQQQGVSPPATRASILQPASRAASAVLPAIVGESPRVSAAVASGKPDVFGTVALSVGHTPLDGKWRRVERARLGGAHAAYAASLRKLGDYQRVEAVNRYVNRRVSFVDDSRQYGRADLWSAAAETLRRGRGDCEDYAIAKLQMLRAAGFADRDLYLVVLKDLVRRSDHAVLVVRAAGRMLVLDNGTDVIADSETVRDYRPILTFAGGRAWTHGYQRSLPAMTVAAATFKSAAPSAN